MKKYGRSAEVEIQRVNNVNKAFASSKIHFYAAVAGEATFYVGKEKNYLDNQTVENR